MIENYLNVRNSLRNLSDKDFENIISTLAQELETVSYIPNYSDKELLKSWNDLCLWTTSDSYINSTSRIGMKLCEHFFPNFYDIEMKGQSFNSLWKSKNLEKILRWNRKSHSTPYLSELKRGIYFCCGLTKNTMYRPQMAKMICDFYDPKIVLDPCAGWGGRMLGCVASGAYYIAFEPNTKTYNNLTQLMNFLGIQDKVTLICDDALNMEKYDIPNVDLVLTSPPYFDLEIYSKESTQSIANFSNYRDWSEQFLKKLIGLCLARLNDNGTSCWNVGKVSSTDMNIDVLQYHKDFGYDKTNEFMVISSKRQSINKTKNEKSTDNTIIYKKVDINS